MTQVKSASSQEIPKIQKPGKVIDEENSYLLMDSPPDLAPASLLKRNGSIEHFMEYIIGSIQYIIVRGASQPHH
jgi:hypothetical protein